MMQITDDQLNTLGEFADELDNLSMATLLNMPPAFHLKQLQKAMPDLSNRIKALVTEITGDNPWKDHPKLPL